MYVKSKLGVRNSFIEYYIHTKTNMFLFGLFSSREVIELYSRLWTSVHWEKLEKIMDSMAMAFRDLGVSVEAKPTNLDFRGMREASIQYL